MKKQSSIFESKDYKQYLRSQVGGPTQKKGVKSAMARALGCQPTYITHILNGNANLSLEQAEALNSFFAHTKEEGQIFLLMVLRDRSGTHTLQSNFQEQIDRILANRLVLTQRLGQRNKLSEAERAVFYSAWYFLAVQIGLTIPEWRTHEVLAKNLGLTSARAAEILQFLCDIGLVKKEGSEFSPTETQIRLGNDSHHILKHHTNWRIKSIESLEDEGIQDLHYSGVVSLSEADVTKIKNMLLDQLNDNLKVVEGSKEERLYVLNIDFFNLVKTNE
jgi:uncharacterized protein (TIGR02147 family)